MNAQRGAIWGGEFLLADFANYQRLFHLAYLPLPDGVEIGGARAQPGDAAILSGSGG